MTINVIIYSDESWLIAGRQHGYNFKCTENV